MPAFEMDRATSERWVVISAAIVAGIYAYRRVTETVAAATTSKMPTATKVKSAAGIGPILPVGAFATAWGFTFLVVSILASASPGLGGSFAILIAVSDFLTNSATVLSDVGKQEVQKAVGSTAATVASSTTAAAGSIGFLPGNTAANSPLDPLTGLPTTQTITPAPSTNLPLRPVHPIHVPSTYLPGLTGPSVSGPF